MQNRFLLEAESSEKVIIGIEFNKTDTSIQLYVFKHKKGIREKLVSWTESKIDLPKGSELIKRTIADQNLLPEDIKVKDIGKVRFIENAWAESMIQTRLLQSFNSELNVLTETLSTLDNYSENLFQECSSFWKRLLEFKRENKSIPESTIDNFKIQLDVLFEALISLRKEHKKEIDSNSIVNKENLSLRLDEVKKKLKDKSHSENLFNTLKEIRTEYTKSPMRKSHKEEIDKRINQLFDEVSKNRKEVQNANSDKRITDLEEIIVKMNKALDWKIRELKKEEKNLEFVAHAFQEKLIESKIKLIQKDVSNLEVKISDIHKTLKKLKL